MPLYLIEREFAEALDMSEEDALNIQSINADEGVKWLHSFLSANKRKTYCLYQAANPDAIRRAAERAGIPATKVVLVDEITPPPIAAAG